MVSFKTVRKEKIDTVNLPPPLLAKILAPPKFPNENPEPVPKPNGLFGSSDPTNFGADDPKTKGAGTDLVFSGESFFSSFSSFSSFSFSGSSSSSPSDGTPSSLSRPDG